MKSALKNSKLLILLLAARPKFLVASAAPVLVGSAAGFAAAGTFQSSLFLLALLAIMALHAGANITNDYFDHTSGNDWLNRNPTPFSGGRRYIQQNILSARATMITAFSFLAIGSAIGLVIVLLTRSFFVLILGLIGLLGGYFYTASPIRLGYRCFGESVIALLFGLLAVYGSYYLQTRSLDYFVLLPASLVSILIFLVILINEFPDHDADAAVNKKTLVVRFGITAAIRIYRIALAAAYVVAAAMLFYRLTFFAGLFFLLTLPLAISILRFVNKTYLTRPDQYRPNQLTILLHAAGSLTLTAGLITIQFLQGS